MHFEPVEFPAIDLQTRAAGRLLRQFRRSPVLLQVLHALVAEIQEFMDACGDVLRLRTPHDARGEQLNAIGRIVGQDRVLVDYSEIAWFAPDLDNRGADQSPVWCVGAPLLDTAIANDELYRTLIQAKVYRNFVRYGSISEIQEAAREAFGVPVSFQRTGPVDVALLVPRSVPLHVLGFLTEKTTTVRADDEYISPYPATVRITDTMFLFDPTFQVDTDGAGGDQGQATVAFYF